MADSMTCPGCGARLEVPEESRGQQTRCSKCQTVFAGNPSSAVTAPPPRRTGKPSLSAIQPGPPSAPPTSRRRSAYVPQKDEDVTLDALTLGGTKQSAFTPGGALVIAVTVLLALNLLSDVSVFACNLLQYNLATRILAGQAVPPDEIQGNDLRQHFVGIVSIALLVIAGIVFLVWFHRVYANLEPLGARDLEYTPGSAVWFWFIPIFSLYRPMQVAQEIWRNSDPRSVAPGAFRQSPTNSTLIAFWWAAWVISGILGRIAAALSNATAESVRFATGVGILAVVISIVAGIFALTVVWQIDARQVARAQALWPKPDFD